MTLDSTEGHEERSDPTGSGRSAGSAVVPATPVILPGEGDSRAEVDLGSVAGVTDRGRHHRDNQDAFAVASANGRAIFAVCDGVSSSEHPELAARRAAGAVMTSLAGLLGSGPWPDVNGLVDAVALATLDAEEAVREHAPAAGRYSATTIVLGAVGPGFSVIGSVGDSRAYWLDSDPGGSRLLTVDDSWAQEAIGLGVPPEEAYSSRHAHVITRCLRTDDTRITPPNVAIVEVTGPGTLCVCTDGLWNYAESADELAAVAAAAPDRRPLVVASHLLDFALDSGGFDNVTVVVVPVGPGGIRPVE